MPQVIAAAGTWVFNTVAASLSAAGASAATQTIIATAANLATQAALYAATAYASAALNRPPRVNSSGSPVQFTPDPEPHIPFACGQVAYAGTPVACFVGGEKNKYLTFVSVMSLGPILGFTSFLASDLSVVFNAPGRNNEEASGYYLNRMWRLTRTGLPDQTAMVHTATGSKDTPADHSGNMPEWTSAHRLRGLAGTLWTLESDPAKYQGVPRPLNLFQGMKVWDPRADSTYPGGSGTQRRDDWRTWAYSANPGVHALAWARGHYSRLATGGAFGVRLGGIGAPDAQIDIGAFVETANVADANGWTISGVPTTADDKWQVLRALLQAGGAEPLTSGAKISCLVRQPRTSILTVTEADLAGDAQVNNTRSRRERFNRVIPRYRSSLHRWEIVPGTPVSSSTYLAEDRGEPRTREFEYPYVAGGDAAAEQAGQLAAYDLCDSREGISAVIPFKPYLLGVRAGDCITVTLGEGGLASRKVLVTERKVDLAAGVVTLSVRSETDAKHAFALGRTDVAPASPALTGDDPSATPQPSAGQWAAVGTAFTSAGASVPAIVVTGTSDDYPACSAIVCRFKPSGASLWATLPDTAPTLPTQATRIEITGLTPATAYDVEIGYRNPWGTSPTAWRALGPVTAGALTPTPPGPNLVPGGGAFERWEVTGDVEAQSISPVGPRLITTGTGAYNASSPLFPFDRTRAHALQARPARDNATGLWEQTIRVVFRDAGGTQLGVSAALATAIQAAPGNVSSLVITANAAHASTVQANVEFVGAAPAGVHQLQQVKLEQGGVASGFSDEASVNQGARIPVSRSVAYPTSPGSPASTVIAVAAHDAVFESGVVESLPADTLTGLTANTLYGVFWRLADGYEVEVSPAPDRMTAGRWTFVGWHQTAQGGGGYAAPPTVPGGYRGGSNQPLYSAF